MIFSVFEKNQVLGYSWSTLLWHQCYYPHRSRDALSPVCGIFSKYLHCKQIIKFLFNLVFFLLLLARLYIIGKYDVSAFLILKLAQIYISSLNWSTETITILFNSVIEFPFLIWSFI